MSMRKKFWLNIIGWVFLILGIIGFFTPILQGILFTLIGLTLLSQTSPWAKKLIEKYRQRYPNVAEKSDEWIEKIMNWRWKWSWFKKSRTE